MNYVEYKKNKCIRYLDSFKHGFRQFPPSLHVSLTDKCFNACAMCGHWRRSKLYVADYNRLITFLKVGKALGLETVCYSGGDPFTYNAVDLRLLLEWHVASGIKYGFVTSGFVSPALENCLNIICKAEWIRVSLDAVDNKLYEKIRGGINLNFILNSIDLLLRNGANVSLGITVQENNAAHLGNIFEYAISKKIKERGSSIA